MTTIASVTQTTATTTTINMASTGADGTLEFQFSPRPDFSFCVCPVVSVAREASPVFQGLNQATTYWVRSRNRSAQGVVEPWGNTVAFTTPLAAPRNTAPAAVMIEPATFVVPISVSQIETTGGDLPGFPRANLLRDSPVAWRGLPDAQNHYSILIRTSGQAVDTIALLNSNMPESAQVHILGGNDFDQLTAFDYTFPGRASANMPGRMGYHGLYRLPQTQAVEVMAIVIIAASMVPGRVMHIEHLVVGKNRVSKNHALEKSETPQPLTSVDRKRSGNVDRVKGRPMRKVDFELQMLTEAQYETIYGDLWQYENEAVLVVPNSKPGAFLHDRILFGDLTGGRIINPASPRYNRAFTINSII